MSLYALATSSVAVYILSPFAAVGALLAITRILTTINYWRSLNDFKDNGGKQVVQSPQIPYYIPFVCASKCGRHIACPSVFPYLASTAESC